MTNYLEQLQKPFSPKDIEWRVQRTVKTKKGDVKAVVLAYVTNRAIMNRLDEVFGLGGWKNEFKEWRTNGILCGISVKIGDEWITKWDGADQTAIEATKGGFSGSMKRAAVQLGIGRYLYNLTENWVEVKEKGEHFLKAKIKENGKDVWVQGYWDTPTLPEWAQPQLTVDDVVAQWIKVGGKEDQFDEYIEKTFNTTDREKLKPEHLAAIKKMCDLREGKY